MPLARTKILPELILIYSPSDDAKSFRICLVQRIEKFYLTWEEVTFDNGDWNTSDTPTLRSEITSGEASDVFNFLNQIRVPLVPAETAYRLGGGCDLTINNGFEEARFRWGLCPEEWKPLEKIAHELLGLQCRYFNCFM